MTTLFLKYRPQNFSDLVGQESIVKTLRNALKNDKPAHAYLFVGSRGTGKTSTARIFAKGLNSFDQKSAEILENDLTAKIASGDCVDIVEIDAASHTGVDNIRDLIEKIQFLPTYTKRKVYIIDEVHMLSKGAFNALLKTLEEPPEHAYFLLATTELHKVPDTIVSRCQTFIFGRFTLEQLVNRLEEICSQEKIFAEKLALEMIAKQAEGGLRDAISLLEQMAAETESNITADNTRKSLGISTQESLEKFWHGITTQDTESCLNILKTVNKNGGDFRTFGHDFLGFLREQMHQNMKNPAQLQLIIRAVESIQTALSKLKFSPIVELPLEIAVIELCTSNTQTAPVIKTPTPAPAAPAKPVSTTPEKKSADFSPATTKPAPAAPIENTASAPAKTTNQQDALTVSDVVKHMPAIGAKSGVPVFVKKSFMTSSPQIMGNTINFAVSSSFHLEQLDKAEHRTKFSAAIEEVLSQKYQVEFSRGMKSATPTASSAPKTDTAASVSADDFLVF